LHTYLNVYTQTNKLDINDQLSNIERQRVAVVKMMTVSHEIEPHQRLLYEKNITSNI